MSKIIYKALDALDEIVYLERGRYYMIFKEDTPLTPWITMIQDGLNRAMELAEIGEHLDDLEKEVYILTKQNESLKEVVRKLEGRNELHTYK